LIIEDVTLLKNEQFVNWCDKGIAFSFYALIYFLPISIALCETFTGTALLFYLLKRGAIFGDYLRKKSLEGTKLSFWKRGREFFKAFKPIDNCLNWPIVIFLFFNLISVIFSQFHRESIEGFLGKSLQSAFIYFNFIECMKSEKRLKIFITVFLISCGLICINGLTQFAYGEGFVRHNLISDGRISSSLRAPNDFAAYLIVVAPILLGATLTYICDRYNKGKDELHKLFISGWDAILCGILFFVSLACLGLTYSRGAWLGFLVAFLFFSFTKKRFFLINCCILILFFGIFYPRLSQERRVSLLLDTIENTEVVETEEGGSSTHSPDQVVADSQKSFIAHHWESMVNIFNNIGGSGRQGYWWEAIHMVKDYPAFGVGINAYSLVAPKYKVDWGGWGGYPHNSYLQMAAEIGLIGISSFLWMLFVLFRESFKALKRTDIRIFKMLLYGFLTGLLGFLIHSFFDTNFYSVQLGSLLWIIMGTIYVLQRIEVN